jgi:hypothetical protein
MLVLPRYFSAYSIILLGSGYVNLSCDKGHSFSDIHLRHRYTQDRPYCAYFLAAAALKALEFNASPKQESALLAAALSKKASVFALFQVGGQGTNEVYFDELQNLY